jgi:hypothetical protein
VLKIIGFKLEGSEQLRGLRHRSYNNVTVVIRRESKKFTDWI